MNNKIIFIILSLLVFIMCYPVVFIVTGSLMSDEELIGLLEPVLSQDLSGFVDWPTIPSELSITNYKTLFLYQPGFFVLFWNSVKICVGVVVGQIFVAIPAAWAFCIYDFKMKKLLFAIYIIFMLLPFQVLMLPEYILFDKIGVLDTIWAIILPGIFSTFPVFIMRNFFVGISIDTIEAARLDGASELKILIHIGIPEGLPGICAIIVLQFLEYWNLIEQPMLFIENPEKWPLSLYLPSINLDNVGLALCAAVVTLIPSYLVFRIGQNSLESGISATSMKR